MTGGGVISGSHATVLPRVKLDSVFIYTLLLLFCRVKAWLFASIYCIRWLGTEVFQESFPILGRTVWRGQNKPSGRLNPKFFNAKVHFANHRLSWSDAMTSDPVKALFPALFASIIVNATLFHLTWCCFVEKPWNVLVAFALVLFRQEDLTAIH